MKKDNKKDSNSEQKVSVEKVLSEQTIKLDINKEFTINPVNVASKIIIKHVGIAGDLYVSQISPVCIEEGNLVTVGQFKEFDAGIIYLKSASRPTVNIKQVK